MDLVSFRSERALILLLPFLNAHMHTPRPRHDPELNGASLASMLDVLNSSKHAPSLCFRGTAASLLHYGAELKVNSELDWWLIETGYPSSLTECNNELERFS